MIEHRGEWAVWAIAALALAAILGGLAVTGGPLQGRAERRDELRRSDLSALSRQAHCIYAAEGRVNGDLGATELCPEQLRMTDPFTEIPYQIEVLDPRHLRLCAGFELDEKTMGRLGGYGPGEWQGDCVVTQLSARD